MNNEDLTRKAEEKASLEEQLKEEIVEKLNEIFQIAQLAGIPIIYNEDDNTTVEGVDILRGDIRILY